MAAVSALATVAGTAMSYAEQQKAAKKAKKELKTREEQLAYEADVKKRREEAAAVRGKTAGLRASFTGAPSTFTAPVSAGAREDNIGRGSLFGK